MGDRPSGALRGNQPHLESQPGFLLSVEQRSRGQVLSIKSRVFDMGRSGTLMLCEHSPNLERYYEPGRECITFAGLEDCAEKALWYLSHETERARIARNYQERTAREHTWQYRFRTLFQQLGLAGAA